MSAVIAGVSYSQQNLNNTTGNMQAFGQQQTASGALSQAVGQQLGTVIAQMVSKNMNIAPTLEIRPGFRFNVMAIRDLTFNRPYKSFDY
jgi:type IV secretion system protein VirB10